MMATHGELRSARWLSGDDEVGLQSRAALRAAGLSVATGHPVIGITNTVSDLNPCNSSMAGQIDAARKSVSAAGGMPVVFPTISLGEDLMKPTAMLYRNLLSIEIEEMVRSHPIDGLIITGSCDKTIPGGLMAAVSTDIPTVMLIGGPRSAPMHGGRRLAAGTDLWRSLSDYRSGTMTSEQWRSFEACYSCSLGSCNVMGTATTMALVAETLGFTLPGTSTHPADDPRAIDAAVRAGEVAVEIARTRANSPLSLVTASSVRNALSIVGAAGGSTNAIVHLAAIAGRAGIRLSLDDVAGCLTGVRVLVDVQPIGTGLAQDLDESGGLPSLVHAMGETLDLSTPNVAGVTLADVARTPPESGSAIRSEDSPVSPAQAITVLQGNLAPGGAVVKTASTSPALRRHRGPAVVFNGYDDMRARIDDPGNGATAESVLVLRGGGPVGGPGMPEWGMIPIPLHLARAGVTDMVRISDARMSGTSFGTVVLHVSPESAVGGPLALIRDGDIIALDIDSGTLTVELSDHALSTRRAQWSPPMSRFRRGWVDLYQHHVSQAEFGCDFDFMLPVPGESGLIEPTVGRS